LLFQSIFRPDLDIYDVIIRLKSDQIVNQIQAVDFPQKFEFAVKTFDPEVNELLPIVAFDPIDAYLRQLRDTYEEFALFFYDRFGGREIGVLWRPEVFKSQPFSMSTALKCGLLSSTAGADGVQNVATNLAAIVEDFRILGNGIIADIDVKTHNL
jgi:U3 small nucleolar RNA-associated protein 22